MPSRMCCESHQVLSPVPNGQWYGLREQDTFIFRVEGTGALPAQDIVATAMDVLIAKLRNLQVLRALVAPAGIASSSACTV